MVSKHIDEPLLATSEVARWLGIAPRTICTWAECNELPGIKVGRQWRFRRRDLICWLDSEQAAKKNILIELHRPPRRL
jgi:excisionase family DNA binding protein